MGQEFREVSTNKPQRGLGRVFKRPGSPYWQVGWGDGRGNFHRRSSRSTKRQEAVSLLRKKLAEVDAGRDHRRDRITFAKMCSRILTDYRVNGRKSIKRVERATKNLGVVFDDTDTVSSITTARIEAFKSVRLEESASNATINRELAALKRMLKLVGAHPMPTIRMLRENNVRKGFFEKHELDRVLIHLPDHLRPVVICAYITGWRVNSEILTRQWKHVDLKEGWLRLDPGETKGGEGREFPMIGPLRKVFEERARNRRKLKMEKGIDCPWVFPNAKGQKIGLKSLYKYWRTACQQAKLDSKEEGSSKIPHDFRRTAVRNLERAGVPRTAAMKMVGHRTESIYRRYSIVTSKDLEEAGKKLESILSE